LIFFVGLSFANAGARLFLSSGDRRDCALINFGQGKLPHRAERQRQSGVWLMVRERTSGAQ